MPNRLAQDLDHVLAHTEAVWKDLRGARLFVTGGTGFFGCWLVESFCWACDRLGLDATMTILTRSPEAFRRKAPHLACHSAIRLWWGDVRTFSFPTERFTHVIHAAADATPQLCRERPLLVLDTIVEGTRRALDLAVNTGAHRFLLASSGAVYGTQAPDMGQIAEDWRGGPDPGDPEAVYGEGKRMAELLCAVFERQHGLDISIARCFTFAGPYLPLNAHFAVGNFIADCLDGRPILLNGDGTPRRSYLYAADLAIWLWTILVNGERGRAYNVGSEHQISIAELATTVASVLHSTASVTIAREASVGAPVHRYVPSTQRAQQELGLREFIPLTESIRRTAAALQAQATRGQSL